MHSFQGYTGRLGNMFAAFLDIDCLVNERISCHSNTVLMFCGRHTNVISERFKQFGSCKTDSFGPFWNT